MSLLQSTAVFPLVAAVVVYCLMVSVLPSCRADEELTVYNINEYDTELNRAGYSPDSQQGRSGIRRVFFWTDVGMRGDRYTLHMARNRCYRIAQSADKQFSSVNTNGECVELYTRDDCFGAMYRMESLVSACHRNLGDCDLNDRVSSVRLCKERCWQGGYYGNNGGNGDNAYVSNADLIRWLGRQRNSAGDYYKK